MKSLLWYGLGSSLLLLVTTTSFTTTPSGGTSEIEITDCYGPEFSSTDARPRQKEKKNDVFVLKDYELPPHVTHIHAIKIWATRNGIIDLMVWEDNGGFWRLITIRKNVYVPHAGFNLIDVGDWRIPLPTQIAEVWANRYSGKKLRIGFANRWTSAAVPVGYLADDTASVYEREEERDNLPYVPLMSLTSGLARQRSYSIAFCTGARVACIEPPYTAYFRSSMNYQGPLNYFYDVAVGTEHNNKVTVYARKTGTLHLAVIAIRPGYYSIQIKAIKDVQIEVTGKLEFDISDLRLESSDRLGLIQRDRSEPLLFHDFRYTPRALYFINNYATARNMELGASFRRRRFIQGFPLAMTLC